MFIFLSTYVVYSSLSPIFHFSIPLLLPFFLFSPLFFSIFLFLPSFFLFSVSFFQFPFSLFPSLFPFFSYRILFPRLISLPPPAPEWGKERPRTFWWIYRWFYEAWLYIYLSIASMNILVNISVILRSLVVYLP